VGCSGGSIGDDIEIERGLIGSCDVGAIRGWDEVGFILWERRVEGDVRVLKKGRVGPLTKRRDEEEDGGWFW
jgi:hypothetical protein